jgi:hypothetical protein
VIAISVRLIFMSWYSYHQFFVYPVAFFNFVFVM